MVEDLMTCLNIYQSIINGGYISEDYKNRCEKIIQEINTLNEMIKANQVLNNFDFISLKRDVAAVFHPDHFHGIQGVIDKPDDVLAVFFGSLEKINECIKSGIEINANVSQTENEERRRTRRNQANYDYDYNYNYNPGYGYNRNNNNSSNNTQEEQVYPENQDTVFTYISDRFNALFRNIPSNEEDYITILEKFQKKIESYRNKLNDIQEEIESLRRSIMITENEKYYKISEENINIEYNNLCQKLFNAASILYGNLEKRKRLLNNRYYELRPIMRDKVDEFNAAYSALIKEQNQLTTDYNYATYYGDKRKMKNLVKRLKEVDKELSENEQFAGNNLSKAVANEVVNGDCIYKDLWEKWLKAKKRFDKADNNYKKVVNNPRYQKEQIRNRYERKYQAILKTHTDNLQYSERAKNRILQSIQYYIEKIQEFEEIYSQYAPDNGRAKR